MSEKVKVEVIEKTQKVLGKHISKPVLSDKLLNKPPFRFLHDVVTAIIKDTGFLKGLFTETELISANVKERDTKIAFLTKLIEAVKTTTEIDLKVKPAKIIAGLEPSETNKLLQAVGYALDKRIDSTEYVKKINSKSKALDKTKKLVKTTVKEEKDTKRTEVEAVKPEKVKKKQEGSSSRDKGSVEEKRKSKKDKNKKEVKSKISPIAEKKAIETNQVNSYTHESKNEENANLEKTEPTTTKDKVEKTIDTNVSPEIKEDEINSMESTKIKDISLEDTAVLVQNEEIMTIKNENKQGISKSRSNRPKSARPQSGDFKRAIITNIATMQEDTTLERNATVPPMTSLRPPSVRPSSARPGAPRLRPDSALPLHEIIPLGKINVIVENYNMRETDEEETVVIQNAEIEIEQVQKILNIPEDKGHLVEQILEQIHDSDVAEHIKNKNEIDWESEGFHNKDATNREISHLRSQIQSLTRVANPLGKLINYLHEDVESMFSELNMWVNMKREMHKEINKQKKNNEDSSKPLIMHLQELEDTIKKQEGEIVSIRSNILRNDIRIKDLLTK